LDYAKADFTSELIENNTFKFIDNSKGPIVKWLWNFGDGNKSNERNLEYKYVKSGSYSVSLVVENEFGTKDTIVTKVEAKDALSAFYTADILGGKAPLTVSFLNRSFGEAVKYIWNFGDGKSSMEENPTHTYTSSGTYSVSLTVIDANGKFDIKLIDELIFVK
jgi:PKD repeat protein